MSRGERESERAHGAGTDASLSPALPAAACTSGRTREGRGSGRGRDRVLTWPLTLSLSSIDAEALPTAGGGPTFVAPTPLAPPPRAAPATTVAAPPAAAALDDDVFRFLISTDNHLVRRERREEEETRFRPRLLPTRRSFSTSPFFHPSSLHF